MWLWERQSLSFYAEVGCSFSILCSLLKHIRRHMRSYYFTTVNHFAMIFGWITKASYLELLATKIACKPTYQYVYKLWLRWRVDSLAISSYSNIYRTCYSKLRQSKIYHIVVLMCFLVKYYRIIHIFLEDIAV